MAEQNANEYETRTPDQNRVHEIDKRQRETDAVRKLRGRVPRDMAKAIDERERQGQDEVAALEDSHRGAHAEEALRVEAETRSQQGGSDNPLAGMMDASTGQKPELRASPDQFDNMPPESGRGIIQTRHWTDDAPRAIDRIPWIEKDAERIGNSPIGAPDSETRVLVTGAWNYKHQDGVYKALDNIRDRCCGDLTIVTGAAGYAERNAKMWARHNDVKHEEYTRLELGDEPGERVEHSADRNQRMLLDATPHLVLAFPSHDEDPSRNAKLLALWAAENGVPVEVAAINGRTYSHSEARTDGYEPPTREDAEMTYGFSELPGLVEEHDEPQPASNDREARSQNTIMELMGNVPGNREEAPETPENPDRNEDAPEQDNEKEDVELDAYSPGEDNEAPEARRDVPAGGNAPADLSGMMNTPSAPAAAPEARPVRGGQVKASATHAAATHHPKPDNSRKTGNGNR